MDQKTLISDMERRADALGRPLYLIAENVGLARSTFYRWKSGAVAGYDSIVAVQAELSRLEASA